MRLYTLHAKDGDRPRTRLVREGASLWAFVLGPLWLLARGMWLVLLGYLAASAALAAVPEPWSFGAGLAFQILFALHAHDLERWTLRRRGYALRGVVAGNDRDDALLRAVTRKPDLARGAVA